MMLLLVIFGVFEWRPTLCIRHDKWGSAGNPHWYNISASVIQPTSEPPWCRRWRRRRSRGGGRSPAWEECPGATSPGSSYLVSCWLPSEVWGPWRSWWLWGWQLPQRIRSSQEVCEIVVKPSSLSFATHPVNTMKQSSLFQLSER